MVSRMSREMQVPKESNMFGRKRDLGDISLGSIMSGGGTGFQSKETLQLWGSR